VPALRIKYDYRDQMVEYDDRGANRRHTYAYDALGRRIARRTNVDGDDAHTRYFYDDNQVVEEQDNTGLTRATYVYGLYVDEVLSMRAASTAEFFFHADDLHNVMVVTDSAGQVVERYDYADYGAPELSPYRQVSDAEELFDSSPHPSPTAVIQRIADDVTFDRPVTLHSIRWWGGYSYDPATPTSDNFTIRIHADAGGRPGTVLHQTAAGNGVARRTTGRIITSESGDTPEFEYEAALSAPFDAAAGQTYWLSLINDNGAHPARWGWASSPDGDGAIAYQHGAAPWAIAAGFNTAFILLMSESSIGNPYLFNGRRYDPETGWYYYRTRYLDPVIGRFTTRDTAGLWDDEAAMGNAFAYVGSNPWSYVDDDGQGKKKAQRKQRKAERKAKRAAKLEKKAEKKADKAKKAAAKGKNKKAEKLKKKSEKLHKKAEKKLKQAEKAWQQAKDEWDRIGAKKGVRGKGHFAADGSCGIQYEWFNPKGTQYAIFEKYKIKIKDRGFVGTLNISAATHNYEVNGSTFSDSYAPVYCGRNYKVTVWAMPYGGGDLKLGSALIKAPGHPALCYCD
jgi:RHS repeat-associated protein